MQMQFKFLLPEREPRTTNTFSLMKLTKLTLFYSALVTKICLTALIAESSKPDTSDPVEATVKILKSCYVDRLHTVGLAGLSAGAISKTLSLRELVTSVTMIDDTPRIVKDGPGNSESRYKLHIFVVTVTNSSTLSETLTQIKSSIWWNHMASFILLDSPESKDGCSNVFEILWEAWEMNLLRATFMCLHRTKGRLIYTFNPYKNVAPVPWTVEITYKGKNDHIWTLFVRAYQEDEGICENLDFDKTVDLSGYAISCFAPGKTTMWYTDFNKPYLLGYLHKISSLFLIRALNVTPKYLKHLQSELGYVDNTGKVVGITADVINGVSDISLTQRTYRTLMNFTTTTYPHATTSLKAMTSFRGYKSQLDKIGSLLDESSRFGLCLVCLITLLFFKFILRVPLTIAILNVILVISNGGIPRVPKQLGPRIYLGSVFLVAVTIQGIYQGKVSSLLTMKVPLPNINNIQDLSDGNYTIYGFVAYRYIIRESIFGGQFVETKGYNCTGEVLRDSKAACVSEKWILTSDAAKFKLHLSKELDRIYLVYQIRSDWPLEERVNKILSRSFEADLVRSLFVREIRSTLNILDCYENEDKSNSFKNITLQNLSFAFVILGVGLGCATITFFVEIGISHARSGVAKMRCRIRRRLRK